MDRGYRPDSYVDTHPKPAKPKTGKTVPIGASPVVLLKQELKEATSEREMLAAELGFTQKELEEDIRKISNLERDIAKLNVALKGAHEEQDELERERALLKSEIAGLNKQIEALCTERDDLKRQVAQHLSHIADLDSQLATAKNRIADLELQLQGERQEAQARYQALDDRTGDTISKQSNQIGSLTTERDGLKARVAELEARVAQLEQSELELTRLNHQYQLQLQVVKRETQREEGAAASKKQREILQQDEIEMSRLRMSALVNGTFVEKYCRNGKIHEIHMRITPDKKEIVWKDVTRPMLSERRLVLDEVTHLVRGQTTPVFTRVAKDVSDEVRQRSFSLITPARSVDVIASAAEVCDLWLKALTTILPLQIETA